MTHTDSDKRLAREQEHGRWIAEHGEEIWNWSSPAGRLRWARRVALFRELLSGPRQHVLEIGCGTGLFTAELASTGQQITAIDISPVLLARARKRVTADNVVFALENAYATMFPDACFDAIVGSSCLHHLELKKALQEFYRLLKPGGGIMFTEPNMLNPQIALQKNIPWLKRMAGDSPDETAFIRFSLKRDLHQAGFSAVSIIPFDFVHPALPAVALPLAVPFLNSLEHVPLLREIAGSLAIRGKRP
jgi:SAM-dependent methyltransferase